jgi:hypothetical protein
VRDGLVDHDATQWYAGGEGKSIGAHVLTDPGEVSWRKISITLIIRSRGTKDSTFGVVEALAIRHSRLCKLHAKHQDLR